MEADAQAAQAKAEPTRWPRPRRGGGIWPQEPRPRPTSGRPKPGSKRNKPARPPRLCARSCWSNSTESSIPRHAAGPGDQHGRCAVRHRQVRPSRDRGEKLARLAGIVLAHPGLKLDIEGHTDSTGSDELNQKLSDQRADSVRKYLMEQGMPETSLIAVGSASRCRWPTIARRRAGNRTGEWKSSSRERSSAQRSAGNRKRRVDRRKRLSHIPCARIGYSS